MKFRRNLCASLSSCLALLWIFLFNSKALATSFSDDFHPYWGGENVKVLNDGQTVQLSLDKSTGCGFVTNHKYLFGYFSAQLKLIPGNSAGTLTSFYLSSKASLEGDLHDEVDFEFLGNVSGQPYILQTNVYTGGSGGREQRVYLWFDPTAAYHWYSVMWNRDEIVFWVDSIPIRSFKNNSDIGVPYLYRRPMALYSSMFDASDWATQGGRLGVDWTQAPFMATYTGFTVMGCKVDDNLDNVTYETPCDFQMTSKWWGQNSATTTATIPNVHMDPQQPDQNSLIRWIHDRIMIYNYCTDYARYPTTPLECSRNEP